MDGLTFLYKTAAGRCVLKILASRAVSKLCGAFMDSPLSSFLIKGFVKKNNINCNDYELDGIKTFNQFFRRRIKDGKRPFDMNPDHMCAPCDGLLSAYPINDEGTVVPIKQSAYTITSLLNDKELASRYNGGWCLVFRLCVDNYHRYAYPVSGTKGPNIFIPGILHTVRPIALETFPVFAQNCREYTVIESKEFGKVVQMEVGAMLVGRICNHHRQATVERGQEKGFFQYGGSTIIALLEPGVNGIAPAYFEAGRRGEELPVRMGQSLTTRDIPEA